MFFTRAFNLLRKNRGLTFFWLMSALGLLKVMLERPVSGHYRIFTGAARLLWQRQDPYEFDFQTVGTWFYSPACGMFFFSMFSPFQPTVGLLFYSLFSIATFYFSMRLFLRWTSAGKTVHEWSWFFSAVAMYQGLLAAKVEIVMVSIILVSVTVLFAEPRRSRMAEFTVSILMGMILEWKFQPAPVIGLLSVILILRLRRILPVITTGASAAIWHFLPALWLGTDGFRTLIEHQSRSLSGFLKTSFTHYDNLFHFFATIGVKIEFHHALLLSASIGFIFLFRTVIGVLRQEQLESQAIRALALGLIFLMSLSPMAQNNASIFLAPVYSVILSHRESPGIGRKTRSSLLWLLIFLSFAYSDLVPPAIREFFRDYSLKSVLLLAYGFWLVGIRENTAKHSYP